MRDLAKARLALLGHALLMAARLEFVAWSLSAAAVAALLAWRFKLAAKRPSTDDEWIAYCHEQRNLRIERPSQSNFRVTAVVVFRYRGDDTVRHVVGHNDEACNLNNSCCAERAAFLQLAGIFAPRGLEVSKVFITTDAPHAVTPGAMCREFMLSSRWAKPTTRVVMEGEERLPSRISMTLEELMPHASVFTRLRRNEQCEAGKRLGSVLAERRRELCGAEGTAWRAAVEASASDDRDELHPLRFGACVVFRDGLVATAWQKKALEYGCSLDAVCQLAQAIEEHKAASPPAVVCMADHFGLLHGPFACARAYLCEHGYGDARVLVHDEFGAMHAPAAKELLPGLPLMGNLSEIE